MIVELHLLQNFAPSNLNRDDTGQPKDCEFGGYRRARISSQCLKRAIRTHFKDAKLLPPERLAVRTKRLVEHVANRLAREGKDLDQAQRAVEAVLNSIKLKTPEDRQTQYLVFAGESEIAAIASACLNHWNTLAADVTGAAQPAAPDATSTGETPGGTGRGRRGRSAQAAGGTGVTVPPDLSKEVERALDGGKAADLALFGRMLADLPNRNVDAACQVAHAISTHKVGVEFDFYTAVDDLKRELGDAADDVTGAGMMGTVEFNSACFYRYSNVDIDQLLAPLNLDGDADLARSTLDAFIRGSVEAIPTGKQNSMAAQNPPSLVFAVVRERGMWSLANAFVDPVRPGLDGRDGRDGDLMERSIAALDTYWGALTRMYGDRNVRGAWVTTLHPAALNRLRGSEVESVNTLIQRVLDVAIPQNEATPSGRVTGAATA